MTKPGHLLLWMMIKHHFLCNVICFNNRDVLYAHAKNEKWRLLLAANKELVINIRHETGPSQLSTSYKIETIPGIFLYHDNLNV